MKTTETEQLLDDAENALLESKSQVGRSLSALYDIRNAAMRSIRDIETRLTDENPTETKIKKGWGEGGRAAKVVGVPVWAGDRWWVAVIFDGSRDPQFREAAGLEGFDRLVNFTPKKA